MGASRGKIRRIVAALAVWAGRWWWAILIVVVAALIVTGIALSLAVITQTDGLLADAGPARLTDAIALPTAPSAIPTPGISEKDRADLRRGALQYQADNLSKIWTTIVQAIVGVVLAVGGYFTWRNLRVANEAQITNRFTQAIGQLGAELKDGEPNLEVRLGGIYALERIAKDSPRDHWTIMEILTAYVRQNARWVPPSPPASAVLSPEEPQELQELPTLRTDVQGILTVFGRRELANDRGRPARLDLRETDLRQANLREAHLEWAILMRAHLEGSILIGAHLEQAFLVGAHMEEAVLGDAHLDGATLDGADLRTSRYLTEEQVKSVLSRKGAVLPPDLVHLEQFDDENPTSR